MKRFKYWYTPVDGKPNRLHLGPKIDTVFEYAENRYVPVTRSTYEFVNNKHVLVKKEVLFEAPGFEATANP